MYSENKHIRLRGRVSVRGNIYAVTGLRIGGRPMGIEIGGLDNPVLRNPLNHEPYIPGSSLKGKLRSLLERADNCVLNYAVGSEKNKVYFHSCARSDQATYARCDVCHIFGLPGEGEVKAEGPTRLLVRDVAIDRTGLETHVPTLTEIKWEAVIDRITSAADPRQMERVPAGAIFKDFDLTYSLYEIEGTGLAQDLARFPRVLDAMQLLEDDYIGGSGSRGSGKIQFKDMKILFLPPSGRSETLAQGLTLETIDRTELQQKLADKVKPQQAKPQ
jgi:CRISPR-associated protein Csm3